MNYALKAPKCSVARAMMSAISSGLVTSPVKARNLPAGGLDFYQRGKAFITRGSFAGFARNVFHLSRGGIAVLPTGRGAPSGASPDPLQSRGRCHRGPGDQIDTISRHGVSQRQGVGKPQDRAATGGDPRRAKRPLTSRPRTSSHSRSGTVAVVLSDRFLPNAPKVAISPAGAPCFHVPARRYRSAGRSPGNSRGITNPGPAPSLSRGGQGLFSTAAMPFPMTVMSMPSETPSLDRAWARNRRE